MPAKKWIICGECEFFHQCNAGQAKMKGVAFNSHAYKELGCYESEQYYQQRDGRQLNLF